jgi:hypothetical protein
MAGIIVRVAGGRTHAFATVSIAAVALALGIFSGVAVGKAYLVAGWAPRPTSTPGPTLAFPSHPPTYQASGTLTLMLDRATGFAAPSLQPFADGSFGHWCHSEPGRKVVYTVDGQPVGTVRGGIVRAEITISDPYGLYASTNVTVPRVNLMVIGDRGVLIVQWRGPARLVESTMTHGRLAFTDLEADGTPPAGYPVAVSGEAFWLCGAWQPSE